MNFVICWAMLHRELLRMWRVGIQTLVAPIITSGLYLLVLGNAIHGAVSGHDHVTYAQFIIPGLLMMSLQQNAFANTASSITHNKVLGNIIFIVNAPLTAWDWFIPYIIAATIRGILIALGLWLVFSIFITTPLYSFAWVAVFGLSSAISMSALGMIAGLWSEKFDHLAVFQNFFIMPLTFLSGVFYTINHLPAMWQHISAWNPCFYMIDGFRYGFLGIADVSPWKSLVVVLIFTIVLSGFCLYLLKIGYKLRNQ